jgi:transketolase
MEILSRVYAKKLAEWAKDKPEVVLFSADLTSSVEADLFQKAYPDRFLSMGLAEQHMHSMAGGMAREGFKPYIHTFAVFIYRRAYDQIANSIAYPNLPVRMVGFLPGILTPGGATHQAIEDISVMRSLPNMNVVEVGDVTEIETILDGVHNIIGPVYIRMLRGEVPRLFDKKEPFKFNTARHLSVGDDITLFSSGICTEEALRATKVLKSRGVSVNHLHISTLKPFTDPAVLEAIKRAKKGVITFENHSILGGLGTSVAEVMADNGVGKKLVRLGIPDVFAHGASRPYLMKELGLDAIALVRGVERLLSDNLNAVVDLKINEEDLQAVRLQDVHSSAKAEAL